VEGKGKDGIESLPGREGGRTHKKSNIEMASYLCTEGQDYLQFGKPSGEKISSEVLLFCNGRKIMPSKRSITLERMGDGKKGRMTHAPSGMALNQAFFHRIGGGDSTFRVKVRSLT
jgi:hypothetical protein